MVVSSYDPRHHSQDVFVFYFGDCVQFKNCNKTVCKIIHIQHTYINKLETLKLFTLIELEPTQYSVFKYKDKLQNGKPVIHIAPGNMLRKFIIH